MKPFRKEAIDQAAHAGAAALTVALATLVGGAIIGPLAGALIGFALGFVREFTEDQFKGAGLGTYLDLAGWTVGGLIAGAVAQL